MDPCRSWGKYGTVLVLYSDGEGSMLPLLDSTDPKHKAYLNLGDTISVVVDVNHYTILTQTDHDQNQDLHRNCYCSDCEETSERPCVQAVYFAGVST